MHSGRRRWSLTPELIKVTIAWERQRIRKSLDIDQQTILQARNIRLTIFADLAHYHQS